jgi:hypothetical protein
MRASQETVPALVSPGGVAEAPKNANEGQGKVEWKCETTTEPFTRPKFVKCYQTAGGKNRAKKEKKYGVVSKAKSLVAVAPSSTALLFSCGGTGRGAVYFTRFFGAATIH